MTRFSLRTRLIVGLIAVVAVGLGIAEIVTYYSVRSFMLERVDEQVEAAQGPAVARLFVEDSFREFSRRRSGSISDGPSLPSDPLTGETNPSATPVTSQGGVFVPPGRGERIVSAGAVPQNFTANLPPGTYAEVRFIDGEPRATSFGFEETYPVPELPAEAPSGTQVLTVRAIGSSEDFRVRISPALDGQATLFVAVPMTEFDRTMEQLRLTGAGVSGGILILLAAMAFFLVRLGLKPLDQFAVTAANIAAGDMTQRMPVANPRTEIGRLGTAMNDMLGDLEEAFARRERSEEQLRRFLADASHELRTPLTSIRGYAELFDRGANMRPDDLEKVMERISQQSERMSHIVEDLLLLARMDRDRPLAFDSVDIAGVAAEVVEDARHRQPARSLAFAAPGPVLVSGDADRLYQVVNNLVSNALAHTPEGAEIAVSIRLEGQAAVLEVRDAGPGIAEEDRLHVFEPFYRASASRARKDGGSGLGLAIVKAIVEAHEGSVQVREVQPRGTLFAITLPSRALRHSDPASSRSAQVASAPALQPSKTGRASQQTS